MRTTARSKQRQDYVNNERNGRPASAMQTPEWDEAIAAFADEIAAQVAADGIGGIAAGVVVEGDLVWARGFGWSERDGERPMAPGAVSRTGSISKSVTGMLHVTAQVILLSNHPSRGVFKARAVGIPDGKFNKHDGQTV